MAFLVSPGVQIKEIDLTNVVPAVATSIGAIAGCFQKGPVSSVTNISSEEELLEIFGKPLSTSNQFETWFTAANFLQYSDSIKVVRAESAIVNAGANSGILIRDDDHYEASFQDGQGSHGEWAARTAGTWANGIGIQICATATSYEQELGGSYLINGAGAVGDTSVTIDDVDASGNAFNVGDLISFFSDSGHDTPIDDFNEYEVTAINTSSNVLTIRLKDDPNGAGLQNAIADNSYIKRRWKFYDLFDGAPGTSQWATDNARGSGDEMHIVVYDYTGEITGFDVDSNGNRTNGIIETYKNLSKNINAKSPQGDSIYYPNRIFKSSQFVYWMDHNTGGANFGEDISGAAGSIILNGTDGSSTDAGDNIILNATDSGGTDADGNISLEDGTSGYSVISAPTKTELAGGTDDYALNAGEYESAYD